MEQALLFWRQFLGVGSIHLQAISYESAGFTGGPGFKIDGGDIVRCSINNVRWSINNITCGDGIAALVFLGNAEPAIVIQHALAAGCAHGESCFLITGQCIDSVADTAVVVGLNQDAVFFSDYVGNAAHCGADHRQTAGHGLDKHQAEGFCHRR